MSFRTTRRQRIIGALAAAVLWQFADMIWTLNPTMTMAGVCVLVFAFFYLWFSNLEPTGPTKTTHKYSGVVAMALALLAFVLLHVFSVPRLLWGTGRYGEPAIGNRFIIVSQYRDARNHDGKYFKTLIEFGARYVAIDATNVGFSINNPEAFREDRGLYLLYRVAFHFGPPKKDICEVGTMPQILLEHELPQPVRDLGFIGSTIPGVSIGPHQSVYAIAYLLAEPLSISDCFVEDIKGGRETTCGDGLDCSLDRAHDSCDEYLAVPTL